MHAVTKQRPDHLVIDCGFPGGNIVTDGIEDDLVRLHQDLRDTEGDWFYWYFRVRGGAGRALRFAFPRPHAIGLRGPAVSLDAGENWQWAGAEEVDENSFRYAFGDDAEEVRFCFAVPYLEADLHGFLDQHHADSSLRIETLCRTRKGQGVELLRLGRTDGHCRHRVLLACRHHCCEMMASYALEGIMAGVLADDDTGRWLRESVEFLVLPFMDKDGVQDGDQGKNRRPHDHNRDYMGRSIYPSVAALRELLPAWAGGRLHVALDLHCPWVRDDKIQLIGGPDAAIWERVTAFSLILESVIEGPLPYDPADNIPHGQSWNTGELPNTFGRWAAQTPGIMVSSGVELPYADVKGRPVTRESARAFGRDLARALCRYLEAV
jgi:hypothetical protein